MKLYFFRLKNKNLKRRLDSLVKMPPKWAYVCGVCNKSMKATTQSIACVSCCNWIHLKQCAKLSFKEAMEKKKSFKCLICVESDNVSKELLYPLNNFFWDTQNAIPFAFIVLILYFLI